MNPLISRTLLDSGFDLLWIWFESVFANDKSELEIFFFFFEKGTFLNFNLLLYCWCHSDSASVVLYFTLNQYAVVFVSRLFQCVWDVPKDSSKMKVHGLSKPWWILHILVRQCSKVIGRRQVHFLTQNASRWIERVLDGRPYLQSFLCYLLQISLASTSILTSSPRR